MTNPQEELIAKLRGSLVDKDNFPRMKQERCASRELVEQAIAEIQRLDRRDDYQTVKLLLSMLQNNPWPYADTRWEFIEKWCEQYIKVNNRYEDEK